MTNNNDRISPAPTYKIPGIPDGLITQNPHGWEQHMLDALAELSASVYDQYYDFLARYSFDFSLDEKNWMVDRIAGDIKAVNADAQMDDVDDDTHE